MTHKKVLFWNAAGLSSRVGKLSEFRSFIQQHKFDIVLVNESHVYNDKKPPNITGYKCVYKNRYGQRPKGGLVSYYKNSIATYEVPQLNIETDHLGIKFNADLTLYNIYITSQHLNTRFTPTAGK